MKIQLKKKKKTYPLQACYFTVEEIQHKLLHVLQKPLPTL